MTQDLILRLNQAISEDMGVCELDRFGLPMRVLNKLERAGIISLRELLYCTDDKLLKINQIGPKQLIQIKAAVLRIGK